MKQGNVDKTEKNTVFSGATSCGKNTLTFFGVYFFYFKSISQTRISSETSGDVYTNTCRYISEDYFFKQNVIFV